MGLTRQAKPSSSLRGMRRVAGWLCGQLYWYARHRYNIHVRFMTPCTAVRVLVHDRLTDAQVGLGPYPIPTGARPWQRLAQLIWPDVVAKMPGIDDPNDAPPTVWNR